MDQANEHTEEALLEMTKRKPNKFDLPVKKQRMARASILAPSISGLSLNVESIKFGKQVSQQNA
jgi:hypothetical protein